MFVNDPFQDRRIALAVPRAFGINDGDGSAFADAQAVGLGSEDAALFRKLELLQTALQEVPRGETARLVTALRGCLVAAQKNVPSRDGNTNCRSDGTLRIAQI